MAVVDLGKLRFDWKGDFSDTTPYEERDVVRYQGSIWFFTANHLGSWNPSNADIMLAGIDVITTEGDLITGDASGLNSRLPVDYDFTGDIGATRSGTKAIVSSSTVPLPASVSKVMSVDNGALYLAATSNTTTNYVVTVAQVDGNNKFFIDGVEGTALTMVRGSTYVFDVSDATNTGHPFRIKEDGGAAYTTGVTVTGTEGTAGATVTFVVPQSAPDGLRYYCSIHGDPMGNAIAVTGGTQVVSTFTPFEQDTVTFDMSDGSMVGHPPRFSTLPNGIHGGQANTNVSYIEDSNGNKYITVTSNVAGPTNGGDAVTVQRAAYSYVNDSGFTPTYTGSDWPYILVTGTLTVDNDITATISQNTLTDGTEVLLINGRPAYQHVNDTFDTITGIGGLWVAFDDTGATTTTAYGTASSFSHQANTAAGITFTGTEGVAGGLITQVVPIASPTVYLYDKTETNPFVTLAIDPVAHPQTSSITYKPAGNQIQSVYMNQNRLMAVNSGSAMTTNTWHDLNRVWTPAGYTDAEWDDTVDFAGAPSGTWEEGTPFRPQITVKCSPSDTAVLRHTMRAHVHQTSNKHTMGRVRRRSSSDGGVTWSGWGMVGSTVSSYNASSSRNDANFGAYRHTTNAATFHYQGENVVFPFVDYDIESGYTYEYQLQFLATAASCTINLNYSVSYNNQVYSRKGTCNWQIDEVLL